MQSVSGTNLNAAPLQPLAVPTALLEVNWNGATWTDETANLISAHGEYSIVAPEEGIVKGDTAIAYSASFVLNNSELANDSAGRYSPLNPSSQLYNFINRNYMFGVPIRFSAGYMNENTAERLRQFTGYIFQTDEALPSGSITLNCMDESQKIRHQRVRTILYQNISVDTALGYLCDGVSFSAPNRTFDTGLFTLPLWWADSEDTWNEMSRLAASEGGRVYFDHSGKLHFENLTQWLKSTHFTSRWTFTVSDWRQVTPFINPEDVWDAALVEYAPLQSDALQVVYDYKGPPITVPPNSSKTLACQLQRPCSSITTPVGGAATMKDDGTAETADNRDYVFNNSGGDDMNTSIGVALTTYAQHVDAIITNSSAIYTANLTKFQLRGRPFTGAQVGEVRKDSHYSSVSWPRVREIRGNELIQTYEQADTLATYMRDRLEVPRAIYDVNMPYFVPQLEIGDRVTVVGAFAGNSAAWTRTGLVVGIKWDYSIGTGYTGSYTIMDDSSIYPFPVSNAFIVGTSKYGNGAGSGQIGY